MTIPFRGRKRRPSRSSSIVTVVVLHSLITGCGGGNGEGAPDAGIEAGGAGIASPHGDAGGLADASGVVPNNDASLPHADAGNGADAGAPDAAADAQRPPSPDAAVQPPDASPVIPDASPDGYPAFAPDMPTVVTNGGNVLAKPIIVTVTFPDETNLAALQSLGSEVTAGSYWSTAAAEYGVGLGSGMSLPVAVAPPASDKTVAGWIETEVDAGVLPAYSPGMIYALYIPPSAKFQFSGGDVCSSGVGGYHDNIGPMVYSVVPECASRSLTGYTMASSHEIFEAATDPLPPHGYSGIDSEHISWLLAMGHQAELGDMCEVYHGQAGKGGGAGEERRVGYCGRARGRCPAPVVEQECCSGT